MTRRNEDSGLIDLDALMREAEQASPAAEAVVPARDTRPTLRPPALAVREQQAPLAQVATKEPTPPPKVAAKEPTTTAKVAAKEPTTTAKVAAKEPTTPAKVPTKEHALPAKVAAKEPATTAKVAAESLEAVTTEPQSDPWVEAARPSATTPTQRSPGATPPRRRGRLALRAALGVAVIAAVTALVRTRSTSVAPRAVPSTVGVVTRVDAPNAPPAPAAETPSAPGLSAADLPAASPAPAISASARAVQRAKVGPADRPEPASSLTEAALPPSSPAGGGDLGDAMRSAAGPRAQAASGSDEAASGSTASQVRPSPGAVVGALGSVLPTARACLGPDDPIRSGLIVFKSDGSVARVELRGSKPEDDCVRSALSKAKVAPFVDESFATRVTVRP